MSEEDDKPDATPSGGARGPVQAGADHAQSLLHEPISTDDRPDRRWAYPVWGMLLVSIFVLYHATILLVHNLPSKGLSADLQKLFDNKFEMRTYMQANGSTQSWAMFAPNPHRSNVFMRVLVKDAKGEVWDMGHDIYGRRKYPYLFYDRMGKINRRIIDQKGYRRHYAAWVCRDWERTHDGNPAIEIQFIKMWTRIPEPEEVIARAKGNLFRMGYDPMKLHLHQREEEQINCRTVRQGQLPNYIRERYGFEPVDESLYRPLYNRTWYDLKDAKERADRREGTIESDVSAIQRRGIK